MIFWIFVKSFLFKEIKDMFPLVGCEVIPVNSHIPGAFHVPQGIVNEQCFGGIQQAVL